MRDFLHAPLHLAWPRTRPCDAKRITLPSILFKHLLFSSTFTMASQSERQSASSYTSQSRPNGLTSPASTAVRAEHGTTSNHNSTSPMSAPLQVYLLSDEPSERRVRAGVPASYQRTRGVQTEPDREENANHDAKALEEWMAEVTAHPERAMWYKDFDRVPPSTTQLYGALPSNEVAAHNAQPRSATSRHSKLPMAFCFCCTSEPT